MGVSRMIKFSEGELLDLLPAQMKNDTDMICLSYALKCGVERLLEYEVGTMTANFIDRLPEGILDVLAVELRSPYYSDSLDIEVKRKIVKNTMVWHTKAGTPSAVSEMVEAVFGEGSVVEWPDFTEGEKTPYTFDIETNARFTEELFKMLLEIIERVKNERSHLRRILIKRKMHMTEYVGSGTIGSPKIYVTDSPQRADRKADGRESAGAGAVSRPRVTLSNNRAERGSAAAERQRAAAGAVSSPWAGIGNAMAGRTGSIPHSEAAASGAVGYPHETVGNNTAPGKGTAHWSGWALAALLSAPSLRVGNAMESRESSASLRRSHAIRAVSYPKITIQ